MNEQQIEQMILDAGKTAPRVTPDAVEANIASVHYFTAYEGASYSSEPGQYADSAEVPGSQMALGLLTFCVIVLQNGFTVTGESASASPENFDEEIGRKIAYDNARAKIWPLMGYHLKQKLHDVGKQREG